MTLLQAAKQAIKVLDERFTSANSIPVERSTITSSEYHALRQALEQAEKQEPANKSDCGHTEYKPFCQMCLATKQKPVAWYYPDSDVEIHSVALSENLDEEQKANCVPLYTAPPQREWVGLTDDEIREGAKYSWVDYQAFQSVAWWADEKLKEKNT